MFWAFEPFPNTNTKFSFPKKDYFLTWYQIGGIPTQSKNKAAVKLYLNWMPSEEFQGTWLQFSVRMDVEAPGGTKSVLHHSISPGDPS